MNNHQHPFGNDKFLKKYPYYSVALALTTKLFVIIMVLN
ncbi:hypothetical protein BTHERMOSOX_1455 [Bathymodiolus thermophilus thioautotrophic gill symbiont]|nr:hypothetical protein BTHERMOSOX_1455 [Bathymodiolus thermophilus thioautotrophic gill symbiont]